LLRQEKLKKKKKKKASAMMAPLRYVRGLEFAADVGYVEFLSRVNRVEEEARRNGSWAAPHPWLNLFVSARDIQAFDAAVIKGMLTDGIDGPLLVYPMLKSKYVRHPPSRCFCSLPTTAVQVQRSSLSLSRGAVQASSCRFWGKEVGARARHAAHLLTWGCWLNWALYR
jgi:hypothetical protein